VTNVPTPQELDVLSENELLLRLGRESVGGAAVPQSLGSLIERGRHVLQQAEPKLKVLLCDTDGPKAALGELSHEALHAAIVALIAGTAGFNFTAVAAAYVAAVIARRGLRTYCVVPGAAAPGTVASSAASSNETPAS
jgi:hypothetical protein